MNITPGTLLNNRYRITSVLGQGGMGAVYRALDENLSVPVAVKENLFLTDEYSRQFQREANILASLRHHNLPRVRDYFTLPGVGQYLVMDFIEGEDLRQRIERLGMLPEEEVILIGAHICDALGHLHNRQHSIIHRDIKPGNIKVTPEGDVVLVDFGLAKEMRDNQNTTTGARAMTPGYSPPEQYGTAHTDARSDIYSLGATLYAALTGVIPEDALTRVTGKSKLTPIRSLRPKVNRKLASVIEEALSVDPDDRFQAAEEFKQCLVEAGDMVAKFQESNLVAPPPADAAQNADNPEAVPDPAERIAIPIGGISRPRRRKRNKDLLTYGMVGLLTVVLVVFSILILQRPPAAPVAGQPLASGTTPANPAETMTLAAQVPVVGSTVEPAEVVESTETPPGNSASPIPGTPMPTQTPVGGGFGQIAFASNRAFLTYQIFVMGSDGKSPQQITDAKDGACQPDWSPDGKQIAFISPCTGRRDTYAGSSIYIMNTDGSNIHLLPVMPSPKGDFDPAWSPDGQKIAFTSLRNGRPHIFVYDFTTSLLKELSSTIFPDKQPSWSPDGQMIAYVSERPNGQVWLMKADGTRQEQFSPSGGINNLWPVWSRDGQTLFYSQTSVDVFKPWLTGLRYEDRQSAREFYVPPDREGDIAPVAKVDLSPDGLWIAYESWPLGNNHDIYIMKVNGSERTLLAGDPAYDFGPVWRPGPAQ